MQVVGFVATVRGRFAALANASVAESYQLSSLSGDVLKTEQQRLTTGVWKPFYYKVTIRQMIELPHSRAAF
jgi:hypothetical protein